AVTVAKVTRWCRKTTEHRDTEYVFDLALRTDATVERLDEEREPDAQDDADQASEDCAVAGTGLNLRGTGCRFEQARVVGDEGPDSLQLGLLLLQGCQGGR